MALSSSTSLGHSPRYSCARAYNLFSCTGETTLKESIPELKKLQIPTQQFDKLFLSYPLMYDNMEVTYIHELIGKSVPLQRYGFQFSV